MTTKKNTRGGQNFPYKHNVVQNVCLNSEVRSNWKSRININKKPYLAFPEMAAFLPESGRLIPARVSQIRKVLTGAKSHVWERQGPCVHSRNAYMFYNTAGGRRVGGSGMTNGHKGAGQCCSCHLCITSPSQPPGTLVHPTLSIYHSEPSGFPAEPQLHFPGL